MKDEGIKGILIFCFFTITIPVILYELMYKVENNFSDQSKIFFLVTLISISIFIGIYKNVSGSQDNGLND